MTKAIGGYFELELSNFNNFNTYWKDTILLNSARNCLEYILLVKQYKKVYIPFFTCDVLLEPLIKLNIPYEFYDVDFNLDPLFNFSILKKTDAFLYTNYFGLKDNTIKNIATEIPDNLIIDNAQALFSEPIENIPTFYSPRKFVGVPDGGFVTNTDKLNISFDKDSSYQRMTHLLKRIDVSAESGYKDFQKNDKSLENQPIKFMSDLTERLLLNIDFVFVKEQRKKNFHFLHDKLKDKNLLPIMIGKDSVPMIYPLRTKDQYLKEKLINQKIYCASYWPNVLDWADSDKNSYQLSKEIIALPIDQRYDENDMEIIVRIIKQDNNV
ncbi:hypothetical protein [Chryseobacterium sp.]|uniref:hypothetical protein n=1 Tax=Chryseobacterium sp. TaxID=1871047 RepID=UPI002FC64EED